MRETTAELPMVKTFWNIYRLDFWHKIMRKHVIFADILSGYNQKISIP